MCQNCKIAEHKVFIQSTQLKGMTDKALMAVLNKCSVQKPIHVFKVSKDEIYSHIHFKNEADASTFYHFYHNNSHILCRKFKDIIIEPMMDKKVNVIYDISLVQRRIDEDTFGCCTCLIPSPSSIDNDTDDSANNETNNENVPVASSNINTTDSNANNDTNNDTNNEIVSVASSIDNTTDNNANNDTNNENIPVTSSNINTTEKYNTFLKRLIQEFKDEIKEGEERLERKRKKLKLLQDEYEF